MANFGSTKLAEVENRTFLGSPVLQSGFCGEKQQQNRSNNPKFLVTIQSQYSRQKLMSQTLILPLKLTLYSVGRANREFDSPLWQISISERDIRESCRLEMAKVMTCY